MQPTTGPQLPQWQESGRTSPGVNGDTGYAPELREVRSGNLYRRDIDFWKEMTSSQTPKGSMDSQTVAQEQSMRPERFRKTRSHIPPRRHVEGYGPTMHAGRPGSRVLIWVVGILLVLVIAVSVGWNALMFVEEIDVQGNQRFTDQDIIALSGLKVGMNRLAIKEDEVIQNIERNRYLICELVHLSDVHTVTIRVSERYAVAAVEHGGMVAYTDLHGMVLEKYMMGEADYSHLIRVNGMLVNHCQLGMEVGVHNSRQLSLYRDIMLELRTLNILSWFRELNLNSMDSIYLVTHDDYTVHMGVNQKLHEKLRAAMPVLEHLRLEGKESGTVDVSSPEYPSYIPDSALMEPTSTAQNTGR